MAVCSPFGGTARKSKLPRNITDGVEHRAAISSRRPGSSPTQSIASKQIAVTHRPQPQVQPTDVSQAVASLTSRLTDSCSLNLRVSACSTLSLEAASSATPTYSSTSSLPGRSSAGSMRSGLQQGGAHSSFTHLAAVPHESTMQLALLLLRPCRGCQLAAAQYCQVTGGSSVLSNSKTAV